MEMQNRKRKIKLVIVIICLVLAALCVSLFYDVFAKQETGAESMEQQVELDLVYAYQNAQWSSAVEKTVESFEKAYPEIKVNCEVSYEDKVYEDVLSKKIARDELGDIVQMKTPQAYAASGILGVISEDVSDLVTSVYTYQGKVYGVGAVQATTGIIYNKEMFEKYGLQEPTTYDEFLDLCRKLKWWGVTPIGVGGDDLWHMEYWVNHFFRTDVLSVNEDWLKDCLEGTVSWEDTQPIAMLRHLDGLFGSGFVNKNWLTTSDTSLTYKMSEGEIAMVYTGPWTAAAIQKLNPDMRLGWFYVPDEQGMVYAGDNRDTFWSVTSSCEQDPEKYEAAMKFLTFFYSQENYTALCRNTCTFPLTKADIIYKTNEIQEDVFESFCGADSQISIYIGNEDTPQEFEKIMLLIVEDVLAGKLTVEEGAAKIQETWEQLLAQGEKS